MENIFDETIERMKKEIKRLFGLTNEDLVYRRLNIEIKKPTRPEQIIIKNTYREDGCYGIPDGKKHVTFYFCNKDFTTIKDEGTIHVRHDNVVDKYSNKYNIDLSDAIFVVLYEDYSNGSKNYLVEIYPITV